MCILGLLIINAAGFLAVTVASTANNALKFATKNVAGLGTPKVVLDHAAYFKR